MIALQKPVIGLIFLITFMTTVPAIAHGTGHNHKRDHKNHHSAHAPTSAEVQYIANEGMMITQGNLKILFDPLFHNSYNNYQLPSQKQRDAILAGKAPFDNVNIIFISHAHGDHFSAGDLNLWLQKNSSGTLITPAQALPQLQKSENWDETFLTRITAINLELGDDVDTKKISIPGSHHDDFIVEAVRIPHAGWPQRADVQNIVYRVTIGEQSVVMHMGDADPNDEHYAPYNDHWKNRITHLAFPPYWFFGSEDGRSILDNRLNIQKAIGIHVPVKIPDWLLKSGQDFFSAPGEKRVIKAAPQKEKSSHEH